MRRLLVTLALLLSACGEPATTSDPVRASSAPSAPVGLYEIEAFGANPGALQLFAYVPAGLTKDRPIVVALHGCTQTASAFDDETGWTRWADEMRFALILPQQTSQNNAYRCFQFWQRNDFSRGQGEAKSIVQMVDWVATRHASDRSRVFVTGLSAGAAMTNVMLAAYPDVFAGGAPVAGVAFNCATTVAQTQECNAGTTTKTPSEWGELVRRAARHDGRPPRVSIWHGTADDTVSIRNLEETLKQWTNVHAVDQVADATDRVSGFAHAVFKDANGTPVVETYEISGLGHGQPVDAGSGARQCGLASPFVLDVGICASFFVAEWFGLGA